MAQSPGGYRRNRAKFKEQSSGPSGAFRSPWGSCKNKFRRRGVIPTSFSGTPPGCERQRAPCPVVVPPSPRTTTGYFLPTLRVGENRNLFLHGRLVKRRSAALLLGAILPGSPRTARALRSATAPGTPQCALAQASGLPAPPASTSGVINDRRWEIKQHRHRPQAVETPTDLLPVQQRVLELDIHPPLGQGLADGPDQPQRLLATKVP